MRNKTTAGYKRYQKLVKEASEHLNDRDKAIFRRLGIENGLPLTKAGIAAFFKTYYEALEAAQ